MKVGIELSGIPTSDRARGKYLEGSLQDLGINATNVSKNDEVDLRIMLARDFERPVRAHERRIFDVSDAILDPPAEFSILKKVYQRVIANRKKKSFFSNLDAVVVACRAQKDSMLKYNRNVYVIPDSSFYHRFFDQSKKPAVNEKLIFVWDGQGHNFHFLEKIIKRNIEFFRESDVELKVVTDKINQSNGIDIQSLLGVYKINSRFVEWKEETFSAEVNAAHIGLAPVNLKCKHASAKPNNKLVNYLGLGLPAIASKTMAYEDFSEACPGSVITCSNDMDWAAALNYWRDNKAHLSVVGDAGRSYVLKNFHPKELSKQWAQVIRDISVEN